MNLGASMPFQRVRQSCSKNPQPKQNSLHFTQRSQVVQTKPYSKMPLTQQELENQSFEQDNLEVKQLAMKEKLGKITPEEKENISVLQAKIDNFWVQKLAKAHQSSFNFADIPLYSPDALAAKPIQLISPMIQPIHSSVIPKVQMTKGAVDDSSMTESDSDAKTLKTMGLKFDPDYGWHIPWKGGFNLAVSQADTSRLLQGQISVKDLINNASIKKRIKQGIKKLDPEIAEAIKKTNKGIKSGGEVTKLGANSGLSGAYLVPDGFFKPLSQSPVRENQKPGYQAIREVLAYEISKYFQKHFGQDLGITQTSLATLTSDKFAQGGEEWNKKGLGLGGTEAKKAEQAEQIGIWQERIKPPTKLETHSKNDQEIQKIAFFDIMSGNYDRHGNNLMIDSEGKTRPIDHGEILPDLKLYKTHLAIGSKENYAPGVGTEGKLVWSKYKGADKSFSRKFQNIADKIDPDTIISDLKKKVAEITKFVPEIAENSITEESWELMRLHIITLKEGVKAGLTPLELAGTLVKQVHKDNYLDLIKDSGKPGEIQQVIAELLKQQNQQEGNLTKEDFQASAKKIPKAIQEAADRLLQKIEEEINVLLGYKIFEVKDNAQILLNVHYLFEEKINSYITAYPKSELGEKYKAQLDSIRQRRLKIEKLQTIDPEFKSFAAIYAEKMTWKEALQEDIDSSLPTLPTTKELMDSFKARNLMRLNVVRLGKPNSDLQKVFLSLDYFNKYLNSNSNIGPKESVPSQIRALKFKINAVETFSKNYINKHPRGKKTSDIEKVNRLANMAILTVSLVNQDHSSYVGKSWKNLLPLVEPKND